MPPNGDQSRASWVFGGLLLMFYVGVFVWAPPILPDFKLKMLGILSGLLTGLFAFFITGDISTRINANLGKGTQLVVQATGGFGLAIATVLWWGSGSGLIQSSSSAAHELSGILQGKDGANLQITDSANKVLGVQTSARARELAGSLAENDPKYKQIEVLNKNKNVSLQTFSNVLSNLSPQQTSGASVQGLEAQFAHGIDSFHFGMSPAEVNALLPQQFGSVSSLPQATEFKTADVRYFWVNLDKFGATTPLYQSLPSFHPCWSGQSYITFLFANEKLIHLSVRLYPDCRTQKEILRQFAQSFSISTFNESGPVVFQVKLSETTLAGYTGSDVSSLEVFSNGSPQAQ